MTKCNHNVHYLLGNHPMCLHKLFARGFVGAITKERTPYGIEFHIWRDKLHKQTRGRYAGKYKLLGSRSRLNDVEQIVCAIELAKKHNVQRVEI